MRAPALGQGRTSCAHLLHKNLNFSIFSIGFTERVPPKILSLADDPQFRSIASSLMSPPNKILSKYFAWFCTNVTKKWPFFLPGGLALLLRPTAAAGTAWTILPQICQMTSQVYTGVTGRKERILESVRNPLCGKGWIPGLAWTQAGIQLKILKLKVL